MTARNCCCLFFVFVCVFKGVCLLFKKIITVILNAKIQTLFKCSLEEDTLNIVLTSFKIKTHAIKRKERMDCVVSCDAYKVADRGG